MHKHMWRMYGKQIKRLKAHAPKQLQEVMVVWKAGAEGLSVLLASGYTLQWTWEVCVCVREGERETNKGFRQREEGIYGRKDDGEMKELMRGLGQKQDKREVEMWGLMWCECIDCVMQLLSFT